MTTGCDLEDSVSKGSDLSVPISHAEQMSEVPRENAASAGLGRSYNPVLSKLVMLCVISMATSFRSCRLLGSLLSTRPK